MERRVLDALVRPLLEHVDHRHAGYDRPLTPADCVYCGLSTEHGAPFPMLHTDTEWDLFPDHTGFQLWYLLQRDSACPTQGNIIVVDTEESNGADPPTCYHFWPTGEVIKARNGGEPAPDVGASSPTYGSEKERLGTFHSLEECGFRFRYIDARPGDCLMMNRHQLHMSDPRPALAGRAVDRRAITLRVVIRPPPSKSARTSATPPPLSIDTSAASYRGKALPRIF